MESRASSRIIALDGLRGVAAAIVVFTHCMCVMQKTADAFPVVFRTPFALFLSGTGAVQVFFVLSGFVLTGSLSKTSGRFANLRFLIRRGFRIYPPYWFGVVFAWLASLFHTVPLFQKGFTPWIAIYAAVHPPLSSLLSFFPWPNEAGGLMPVGWTLRIETLFSLIFPLLLLIAVRAHWLLLIAASSAFMRVDVGLVGTLTNSLAFAFAFSMGIALYLEQDFLRTFFARGSSARLGFWLVTSLLLFLAPPLFFPLKSAFGLVAYGWSVWTLLPLELGAAGIVAAAVGSQGMARVLTVKPIAFLGRVSYSLYLLHFTVMVLGTRLLSGPPTRLQAVLLPIGVFAVSLPLAAVAHRSIEMPAIAIGSRISLWLGREESHAE